MAYNFFTQPQGPVISTSLFAENDTAGIAAGHAQPSYAKAAIDGAIAGFETGQNLRIKQHQIDRQPVADRTQDAQAIALEQQNQANALKLSIQNDTQELARNAEIEELTYKATKLNQETSLINKGKDLQAQLASTTDPLQRKQIIFSGQFDDVFAREPQKLITAAASVPLTPDEQNKVNLIAKRNTARNEYQKQFDKVSAEQPLLEEKLVSDAGIVQAQASTGLSASQLIKDVEPVPTGMYATKPDGTIEFNSNGTPRIDPKFVSDGTFQLRKGDKIVASGLKQENLNLYAKYRANAAVLGGTTLSNQLAEIDSQAQQQAQRQPRNELAPDAATRQSSAVFAPDLPDDLPLESKAQNEGGVTPNPAAVNKAMAVPFYTRSGKLNVTANPVAESVLQETLGLSNERFEPIRPVAKQFLEELARPPEGNFGNYSPEQQMAVNRVISNLGTYAANQEFDSRPSLQEQYNDAAVAEHNQLVDDVMRPASRSWFNRTGNPWEKNETDRPLVLFSSLSTDQLHKVTSGKELYALKRKAFYNTTLTNLMNNYRENIKTSKVVSAARGTRGGTIAAIE